MPDLNNVTQRLLDAVPHSRPADIRNASQIRQKTREASTATPATSRERTDFGNGPPPFARAADRARQAQNRAGQAEGAENALRGQANRLRQLRDLAGQATNRQLPAATRRSLTARFEELAIRIEDAARAADNPDPMAGEIPEAVTTETNNPAPPATPETAPEGTANPAPPEATASEAPANPTPTVAPETAPAAAVAPQNLTPNAVPDAPGTEAQATQPPTTAPQGISITGDTIVRGTRIREEEAGLAESAVARDRGLANVQVTETEDQVRFTFRDQGDGRIQATRFERTEQGMVETGTQTVTAPDVREGRVPEGQTAALNFDRLGLQIELDENYAAGDLQGLEITSTPTTTESDVSASAPASQLSIDTPEAAQTAYNRIDQVLSDMARVRDDMRQQRETESNNALLALADLGNQEELAPLADINAADSLTTTLRNQILQQAADAVTAQGEITTDRLLLLLG